MLLFYSSLLHQFICRQKQKKRLVNQGRLIQKVKNVTFVFSENTRQNFDLLINNFFSCRLLFFLLSPSSIIILLPVLLPPLLCTPRAGVKH